MSKRRSVFPLAVLVVLMAVGWVFLSPYLAVRKIAAAADRGDSAALERMVDFPSLRASVRDNVRTGVSRRIARDGGVAATLGGMVVGALADPVVDAAVTPAGIAALTRGRLPVDRAPGEGDVRQRDSRLRVSPGYEDASTFAVRFRDRESGREHMALLLRRRGLMGWTLFAVRTGGEDGG
jgi:hypothetical protein